MYKGLGCQEEPLLCTDGAQWRDELTDHENDDKSQKLLSYKSIQNSPNRKTKCILLVVLSAMIAVTLFVKQWPQLLCASNSAFFHCKKQISDPEQSDVELNQRDGELVGSDVFPPPPDLNVCQDFADELKIDCYPRADASEASCRSLGCCWNPTPPQRHVGVPLDVPWCFYPPNYNLYVIKTFYETESGITAIWERVFNSGYPEDVQLLNLSIIFETDHRLRLRITDANHTRHEVPFPPVPQVSTVPSRLEYGVTFYRQKTGFQIYRKFDTSIGPLVYANQFLQLSTYLPSPFIYGIGEHQDSFLHSTNWRRFTLFAHDQVPAENVNLYGAHPFYMVMERSGHSHGVFLRNSNAMDILITPAPAISFRVIGGILDFYIVVGPSPSQVVAQYTDIVGRPSMPPYWGLGFHLSRWGYGSLNKTKEVWDRTRAADIPYDVQWNDIDYMDAVKDFSYDTINFQGLGEFVKALQLVGMHYVPILDPGVSGDEAPGTYAPYDEGLAMRTFVRNNKSSEQPFVGKVWNPVSTVFVDFTNPNATPYWSQQLQKFHNEVPFDGLWIDMNEPSNFFSGTETGCPSDPLNEPPYVPFVSGEQLYYKTLCMTAWHNIGSHYDTHNLYGLSEAIVTYRALATIRGKRPFIISRSTFPGQGQYSGHWSGDVVSSWKDMRKTIPSILNFNMYGIPLVGADICGFIGNTTSELCTRWMQLGAFYPFARNHNTFDAIEQDPVALGPDVANASRIVLNTRYALLPYLYTLFYRAHNFGYPVVTPVFFEWPKDSVLYGNDQQFLWGSALLVAPILEEGKDHVVTYLPRGLWYNYYTYELVSEGEETLQLSDSMGRIPLLARGGYVIPRQKPDQTTIKSRKNPFTVIAALNENGSATGDLYWDDGETTDALHLGLFNYIEFLVRDGQLFSFVTRLGYTGEPMTLLDIVVMGLAPPSYVLFNGDSVTFIYDKASRALHVEGLQHNLHENFTLHWGSIDISD